MNAPAGTIDHPNRRRLSVIEFERLVDAGTLADSGKTEPIDGEICVMDARLARHARVKARLLVALVDQLKAIDSDLEVLSAVSVRVGDDSMPQPDLAVTRYKGDRAIPAELVAPVVEIADTTLDTDVGRKVGLYAAAGVPEYWVVDVNGGRVVQYDQPGSDGYARRVEAPLGQTLASTAIMGLEVGTAGLVG